MKRSIALCAVVLCLWAESSLAQFVAATRSELWTPGGRRTENGLFGYHDGSSENALGLTNGGQIAWFQGFLTTDRNGCGPYAHIGFVAAANGTTTGAGAPAGNVGAAYVYDDPGGDHTDPTDLTGADLAGSGVWTTTSPNTDILERVAVSSGLARDGFWAAAQMQQAAGEFPAAFDTHNPSLSRTWVTGSNTTFDPHNPGGGIGFFEMSALGFDSVWLLEALEAGGGIPTYCTAKSGLSCGLPSISFSGIPKAGATSGFEINAQPALGNRAGMILYSLTGRAAIPFEGGWLCVEPTPLKRSSTFSSGGTNGACDGVFRLDWNAFASGNAGGNPDPALGNLNQYVATQIWGRDSAATGSFLSNSIAFCMN